MLPNLNSELRTLLIVSLGFMILDPTESIFRNMQKTIVSSIADDKPWFKAEGYTLIGIKYTIYCVTLWFAPHLCRTIGARFTVVLSSFGFLYYIGSFAIEAEWAVYSSAVILGIADANLAPPMALYLLDGSKPKNVSRNVGIFFSLQKIVEIIGNIFVYYTFEGKTYIDQSTRRTVIFGLMGVMALSTLSFLFLPKTKNDYAEGTPSIVATVRKTWNILLMPNMLWMCLPFVFSGLGHSFGDGIYSPSIGFTLAFGNSAKELVALSGIVKSVGSLLGFLFPILLSAHLMNRSYARRLLFLAGALGQLLAFFITFMILPDSASLGNTEDKSIMEPNIPLVLLGGLLLGFGDSTATAQVYSFLGDYLRESTGEGTVLYKFVRFAAVTLNYYWCSQFGLHTQVGILSAMTVVGLVGCFSAEHVSESARRKKSSESSQNLTPMNNR